MNSPVIDPTPEDYQLKAILLGELGADCLNEMAVLFHAVQCMANERQDIHELAKIGCCLANERADYISDLADNLRAEVAA